MKRHFGLAVTMVCLTALLGVASDAYSQDHRFTFNVGAGVTPVVGPLARRLDNGWNISAGAGYRATSHLEADIQFTYNGLGVNNTVLNELGVPGGTSSVWSITLDPKFHLSGGDSRFDPYVVGGVGYYRRTIDFTAPTVSQVFLFDPIFNVGFSQFVPANQVLGSITRGGVGGSLGLGFDMGAWRGTKLFVEARYHYADTGRIATSMVPVTIGLTW